jgi:hypothetical protein
MPALKLTVAPQDDDEPEQLHAAAPVTRKSTKVTVDENDPTDVHNYFVDVEPGVAKCKACECVFSTRVLASSLRTRLGATSLSKTSSVATACSTSKLAKKAAPPLRSEAGTSRRVRTRRVARRTKRRPRLAGCR